MNLQKASGDQNNASGFVKKSAIQPQREAWTDDLDLLPLSERKRILLYHDMPSKGLNGKQIIPDFNKEWPGLPKGVKFDPSDEELLWHLLAEIGKGVAKPHPFISEFIISLDEDDGLGNVHPQFLPGVKKDGSMSFFFHRKVGMYRSRQIKRQKKHDNSVEICWHRIGKSKAVCVDGIHQGSKEVLALYMNPVNGGNPVKTPWLMHQFHIGINGAKEDLVVSKIFYEMRSKQDVQDSQTVSVEGCVSEVVSIAAPLQVASEFHEMLHVESVSAEASTQLFDTRLTPAELPIDELSQKVVDHDIGAETNVGHVGCLKLASSRKYPATSFEKAIINLDQHSEGTLATDELPPLASSCEAAAEISISSTSAKSVKNKKERIVEKITDGFMRNLGDSGNIINNSNYDKVRDDGTCDANAAHVSLEKSCPERASEHDPQKNVVDKMFKTQGRFMATSSCEIKATGICSFTGHISRGKHEIESECLDEALISLGRTSSAEHFIAHENTIDDLFVLGLPTFNITGKISEETEPKNAFEKNSNNWVNISTHSALPIKLEPKSFEGTKMGIDSERSSNYRLNASAPSALFTKVKAESSEEANASIIFEKCVKKLPSFSQLSHPVNSSSTINFCFSKDSIEEKIIPHFYISKEGTPSCCNLSTQTCIPVGLNLPSTEILSATISGLDELSETTGMINQHPEKDDIVYDDLLMSKDNSQVIGDNECVNQSLYPQINYRTGEPQSNSVSSSSSLKVKSEPVETSLQACWQIPPCNTRGYISPMFENKTELPSDSFVDILDHVPLKYRLGISVSKGDENVKCGNNISEEIAPVTSGCRSFGSVNIKENLSSCRRRRKKTATDSLEKAMEEDAPGLLQVLLDRGIQVEEIKLYGDLEDNDPLETSSSEDSFEELEAVMTKLFSERSSLLRFTLGRPMKESRAVYCLACLISLIEQTRYLLFRQTPVEWGWCRDLQSFIFVFQTHNRIVLERPEYGFATYFFELVDSLPIDWQIKRLVKTMKLTNCSRTILLENKPLIVGEDLSEVEARVLEAYGWTPNTGFGTLLNYCDRVVHDRRNEMNSSEWRAKIGKLLMSGYDGGRIVLTNIPEKVVQHSGIRSSDIKMEL